MRQRLSFLFGASILPNSGKSLRLDRCTAANAFTPVTRRRPCFLFGASILPNSVWIDARAAKHHPRKMVFRFLRKMMRKQQHRSKRGRPPEFGKIDAQTRTLGGAP